MSGPLIANLEANPGKETLEGVLRSPLVEPLALHYFATDAAERALLRVEALGQETKAQARKTIQEKRAWLVNACKAQSGPVSSATFLTYITEVGSMGPRLGTTPAHIWRPLWAAESAAGWCSRKDNPTELVQHVSALGIECAISPYLTTGSSSGASFGPHDVEPDDMEKVAAFSRCLSEETLWQCARLAWWLTLRQLTARLWLGYEAECPLPQPDTIALNAGFDALPPPADFSPSTRSQPTILR